METIHNKNKNLFIHTLFHSTITIDSREQSPNEQTMSVVLIRMWCVVCCCGCCCAWPRARTEVNSKKTMKNGCSSSVLVVTLYHRMCFTWEHTLVRCSTLFGVYLAVLWVEFSLLAEKNDREKKNGKSTAYMRKARVCKRVWKNKGREKKS